MIPRRYRLTETPSDRYEERTEWNVRDSDGTVIFSLSSVLVGGSLLTARIATALGKPCLHLSASAEAPATQLRRFASEHDIRVLNVAGPRASGEPGVGRFVRRTLDAAFGTRRASRIQSSRCR